VDVPPSLGSATTRFENIGKVNNKGIEAVVNGVLFDNRNFGWDMTLAYSWLSNRIVDLGPVAPTQGATQATRVGLPIAAWSLRPYTYEDTNGDGMIALSEITVADDPVYVGYSQPRGEATLFTGVEMFGRKLRLQANLDSKFGSYQLNGTERIRCESRLNCNGVVNPDAPLWEQARAVAVRQHSSRTQWGYVEKIDFIRFREVSATWTMPDAWAQLLRAQRATFTVGGRNLGLITNYSGIDPETGYFATNSGTQSDFQSAPPPTYWTFRLNLTF